MNFLSGQDDFFRTGNQPISVRHLSQPYNKYIYSLAKFASVFVLRVEIVAVFETKFPHLIRL